MEVKKEMKDLKLHGEDLHHFGLFCDSMKDEEEIWFDTVSEHHHHQHDVDSKNNTTTEDNNINNNNNEMLDVVDVDVVVNDPSSLFYADFPPLPDFPCMSSSSSSSSTPAATTAVQPFGVGVGVSSAATSSSASTASSGAASWAGLKSDADHDPDQDPASSAEMGPPPGSDNYQQQQEQCMGVVDEMGMDDVDHCMDMMENFGCIDLLENADICWDPSPLFEDNADGHHHFFQNHLDDENDDEMVFEQFMQQHGGESNNNTNTNTTDGNSSGVVEMGFNGQSSGDGGINNNVTPMMSSEEDLAMVFFEWLKSNKEAISADDLRNIKIKKSTIENAAKRLGGGKEGMKQLVKLILQWVQNHHLQNKRLTMSGSIEDKIVQGVVSNNENNFNNNNTSGGVTPATPSDNTTVGSGNLNIVAEQQCFSPAATTWLQPPPPPPLPFVSDSPMMVPAHPPPGFPSTVGYMSGGDPYSGTNPMAAYPPPPIPPSDYHSWGAAPMHYGISPQYGGGAYPDQYGGYGNNPPPAYPGPGYYYHPGAGEGLVRLGSSAPKEARKKRMARQRRFFSHHHRTTSHHNDNHHNGGGVMIQQMMNQMAEQHAVVGNGNATCGVVAPHGNWVYWPPPPPPPPQVNHSSPMVGQMMPPQQPLVERSANGFPKQIGIEKKQGWKTEKNLRFLLQKVLKQSDVGNLGRIVLPKKEAETHLPELEARDGIPIAMEDIGTSRVWNMRYRFWPNNKSRMYLLENTGDFVRSNGLQEGDFIVIYSGVKCGKYMIRGVKVRAPQQGTKPETTNKKPNKAQKTEATSSPSGAANVMQS